MKKNPPSKNPTHYFLLFSGRYMLTDEGTDYSVTKFAKAVQAKDVEIKPYQSEETPQTVIDKAKKNPAYRFFPRGVLVNISSNDSNDFEILGYEPFKVNDI